MDTIKEATIQELINRYEVILFDSYGVLASSNHVLPGAIDLIVQLNQICKPYFVLTNDASLLPESRSQKFESLDLDIRPDKIITAGGLLKRYFDEECIIGLRCLVLGPQDSTRYVENAGGEVVSLGEPFDAVVIGDQMGFPFLETMDKILTELIRKIDNDEEVRLILPNPDFLYPDGDDFGFASGSMALLLESALTLRYPDRDDLTFIRLGKPHKAMFDEALRRSGTMDMVMIGDQLATDIKGANNFTIDSALVRTGITVNDLSSLEQSLMPTYTLASLKCV